MTSHFIGLYIFVYPANESIIPLLFQTSPHYFMDLTHCSSIVNLRLSEPELVHEIAVAIFAYTSMHIYTHNHVVACVWYERLHHRGNLSQVILHSLQ